MLDSIPLLPIVSMLTHHRRPVSFCLVSTDLPVWSTVETAATLYQKDNERFHLLLTEPTLRDRETELETEVVSATNPPSNPDFRLLWMELSPYRVIMTMQGNSNLSYRHVLETGVYGTSRYWLNGDSLTNNGSLRLRNYTRSLNLEGRPLPVSLRVEYELWSEKVQLGRYILSLDIHQ